MQQAVAMSGELHIWRTCSTQLCSAASSSSSLSADEDGGAFALGSGSAASSS